MKTSDFDYELPEELIAQTPVEPRDHSRLMVVHRATGEREDKHFYDIIDYLNPNDALVINETKVIPARLLGEKEDTGVPVEVLPGATAVATAYVASGSANPSSTATRMTSATLPGRKTGPFMKPLTSETPAAYTSMNRPLAWALRCRVSWR